MKRKNNIKQTPMSAYMYVLFIFYIKIIEIIDFSLLQTNIF